ncbi:MULTISPECIES: hypothetical protein [unclassified Streptomyces]|uniref:hypothetical protein n=1 Tax=unclassified Streptomyces TaxID=2593676 RepID=UPI0022B6DA71|nr:MULTISPECIES: hypothetical protein [unclassified Streptomyces]MCZ7413324.1 hypothetical protein [Streptomyces sp. WMMC897]MCZ7430317.1 hypothetical protein [Streptomyces sp. WMMC1477]
MPYFPPGTAHTAPPESPEQRAASGRPVPERRGCLFALSQPPLMLFLAVIGALLLITAVHDLFVL